MRWVSAGVKQQREKSPRYFISTGNRIFDTDPGKRLRFGKVTMLGLRNYESLCYNVMLFIKKKNHATDVGKILGCFQCKTNMRNFVGCVSFSSRRAVVPLWLCKGMQGGAASAPRGSGRGVSPGSLEEPAGRRLSQSLLRPQGPATDLESPSQPCHW